MESLLTINQIILDSETYVNTIFWNWSFLEYVKDVIFREL